MKYLIIVLVVLISGCASADRCQSYQCDYQRAEARKADNLCAYINNIDKKVDCLRDRISSGAYVDIPVRGIQYARPIQAYPNFISLPGGHGMMCNIGYCYGY